MQKQVLRWNASEGWHMAQPMRVVLDGGAKFHFEEEEEIAVPVHTVCEECGRRIVIAGNVTRGCVCI
jgi:hypothetical protein